MKNKTKNNLTLILKGGILGIANIIPGVSGGTMALILGIYEKMIHSISTFFQNPKENSLYLIKIALGALLAILIGSDLINSSLEKFPVITTLFFAGLIAGGVPYILNKTNKLKEKKYHKFALIAFALTASTSLLNESGFIFKIDAVTFPVILLFVIVGILAAGTMVVPGISGSLVLMLIGFYKPIINAISEVKRFINVFDNLKLLIPLGIGVLIGIIIISKLIEKAINKHKKVTYSIVLGILIGSLVPLCKPLVTTYDLNAVNLILGFALANIGSYIAIKLGDK